MAKDPASDVYDCLMSYQLDAMADIAKRYSYNGANIKRVLGGYGGRYKYHGHISGAPGDAVAGEAETNQKAAIQYLRENAPAKEHGGERKKGADKVKAKASVTHTQEGMTILKENSDNLGTAVTKLDAWDKDWRDNRAISSEYKRLRAEKKAKHSAKA
jgi:hypothetical protein